LISQLRTLLRREGPPSQLFASVLRDCVFAYFFSAFLLSALDSVLGLLSFLEAESLLELESLLEAESLFEDVSPSLEDESDAEDFLG
jgi:hypothetical protein